MTSRERIRTQLEALGLSWRRAEIREKAVYAASAALVTIAVGLAIAQLLNVTLALSFIFFVFVIAGVTALLIVMRSLGRVAGEHMLLAQLAERLAPELGSGATSAVDLSRAASPDVSPEVVAGERAIVAALRTTDQDDRGFSRELAEAHFDRMASALDGARLSERLAADRRRRDLRAWRILGGAFVVAVVALVSLRTGRTRIFGWLSDPTAARVSETPLASDLTLTYRFPAYTHLAPRVVEGGDGSITAVVGTEVDLSAVADTAVRSGLLRLFGSDGKALQDIALVVDGKKLSGTIAVLHEGTYVFELVTRGGERLQDGKRHPIHAVLDATPEIFMDSPMEDVELKDDREVDILWHAKDDFGLGSVELVIEKPGASEPTRVALPAQADTEAKTREGSFRWSVSDLNVKPGDEVRFHLEATDNDTISGPKHGSSETRRLTIFSARQRHEQLLAEQREVLNDMVSLLAADLEHPFPREDVSRADKEGPNQQAVIEKQQGLLARVRELTTQMRDDKLMTPQIISAFENVRDHIQTANRERVRWVGYLTNPQKDAALGGIAVRRGLSDAQTSAVKQLETDILYLDDLLAIQNIEELKEVAKDLQTAQHDMKQALADYKRTKDPALKAQLQSQIEALRDRMQQLLQKMAQIRQGLPAEYRNMEAGTMLATEDQLDRLSQLISEGKLDEAEKELEALAQQIDQLMQHTEEAEKEYGGERYDELRKDLADFAKDFRDIEQQQKELADRSEQMLREYRKNAAARAGKSVDDLVKRAREKAGEALRELDTIERDGPQLYGQLRKNLQDSRQRLMDMDGLLEQRDFSEARQAGQRAEDSERELDSMLDEDRIPYGGKSTRAQQELAAKAGNRALDRTREVNAMLDKLFPDPREVLSQDQMQQLQRNQKKQGELEQQAKKLGDKMNELAEQMPLFGGDQMGQLQQARGEMGKAVGQMQGGKLPGAAASERRAADALGQLREALEKASQGGGGGIPLPLGGGQRSGGEGKDGQGDDPSKRDVKIPQTDKNRAAPRYRQELLEAAKQKAPQNYEDAVRKYYEELIK